MTGVSLAVPDSRIGVQVFEQRAFQARTMGVLQSVYPPTFPELQHDACEGGSPYLCDR